MRAVPWLIVLLLVVAVGVPAYAVLGRWVLHGPVDGESLAVSVGREVGAVDELLGDPSPCRELRGRVWRCAPTDGSAAVEYRVRVREGSSCWDARALRKHFAMPRTASGCVHRWQWSLLDTGHLE